MILILLILVLLLFPIRRFFLFTFFWALFWVLNMLFTYLFIPGYGFTLELPFYLILSIIICFIGELVGGSALVSSRVSIEQKHPNIKKIRKTVIISIFLGVFYSIHSILINGFSLSNILSLTSLLTMNNEMAVMRYDGGKNVSILGQVLLCFVYLSPLLSGYYNKFLSKKVVFLSFLPALFVLLTQNTKMTLIASFIFYLSSVIVLNDLHCFKLPKIKKSTFYRIVGGGVVFYFLMVASFALRVGSFDGIFDIANKKFSSYIVHMPTIDNWVKVFYNSDEFYEYSYGAKTFYGISNFIGISERKGGIFQDFYFFTVGDNTYGTNIYTSIRVIIEDFGISGSLLFLGIISFLFSFIRFSRVFSPALKVTFMVASFVFIFYSFVTVVFAYTSYILCFVVFYFLLKINKERSYV